MRLFQDLVYKSTHNPWLLCPPTCFLHPLRHEAIRCSELSRSQYDFTVIPPTREVAFVHLHVRCPLTMGLCFAMF